MSINRFEAMSVLENAECLYTSDEVEDRLDKLAREITTVLHDKDPLVLSVMTGAMIPVGMLLPKLNFPLELDYIHATRYNNNVSGGLIEWNVKPKASLKDRVVLIIDDIFDEGLTLKAIAEECQKVGCSEVYCAVLVNKQHNRKVEFHIDFIGLEVEDRYVFGFGMDYKGYLRNAAGIFAVGDESLELTK